MPKHKKQESDSGSNESESDSGPEDLNPPKKSKTSTAKVLKSASGESYWELDRTRRITVRQFKGKIMIDIREFYEKDGQMLPGKKGISLSTSQYNSLKGVLGEVDDAVSKLA